MPSGIRRRRKLHLFRPKQPCANTTERSAHANRLPAWASELPIYRLLLRVHGLPSYPRANATLAVVNYTSRRSLGLRPSAASKRIAGRLVRIRRAVFRLRLSFRHLIFLRRRRKAPLRRKTRSPKFLSVKRPCRMSTANNLQVSVQKIAHKEQHCDGWIFLGNGIEPFAQPMVR